MPEWAKPLAANIVGRPGWSCYVAYDGDVPAGAGTLYVHERIGWLGFGATLPRFRGRGAQSAILAARIEEARRQSCSVVTTETGEPEIGGVVPELLDPSLQESTVALMKSANLADAARVTVSWEKNQTAMDEGLLSDLRSGIGIARAAGIDVYLDAYPNGSSQTPRTPAEQTRFAT